ncbi:restriction endonuclease subunit S [Glaciecola sp. 2405UD65-10]|uniref:restriction endonuclease subunit S n=1 Tax=Glaciecola sp. 2405UD65-10 TaxID=3397244 RepID=UPI003B5C7232
MAELSTMIKYTAYKDSGLHWLKSIPKEWDLKKFKFILREINQRSVSGQEELLSVSQYTGVTKKADKVAVGDLLTNAESLEGYKKVTKGDLVSNIMLAWNGSLGVSPFDGITSPAYSVYRFVDNCSEQFFHYLLRTEVYKAEFKRRSTGVIDSRLRLYSDDFFDVLAVLPPLKTQTTIVNFLDKKTAQIDEAIAIKQRQIELLKERKQIIIQQAVTRGLDPNVPMKKSGLDWIGEVPLNWQLKKVKHLFKLQMDASEKNNNHELLSVYSAIGVRPRKDLEEKGNKASTTDGYWLVEKGDIIVNKLLAWMGAIGLSEFEGVTSPAYDILRPCVDMDAFFYHYLFRTKQCSGELKKHSRGIMDVRLRLYFDKFGSIYVPYPPVKEQIKIVEHITENIKQLEQSDDIFTKQISKLKEYKTTLINSAVTGKIKVPGVEEPIKA